MGGWVFLKMVITQAQIELINKNYDGMMKNHVERQHLGPGSYEMCGDNWDDLQQLHIHQKCCSYKREVPGCESSPKKLVEPKSHRDQ